MISQDLSTRARLEHLISDLALGGPHYANAPGFDQKHYYRSVSGKLSGLYDNTQASDRRVQLMYHVAVLYDAALLNASEVTDLEDNIRRVNEQAAATTALGDNTAATDILNTSDFLTAKLRNLASEVSSLFPFTAAAMHALYPTQYPKSDFQAPKSPWKKVLCLTHDDIDDYNYLKHY